jgi:hypothetical protein
MKRASAMALCLGTLRDSRGGVVLDVVDGVVGLRHHAVQRSPSLGKTLQRRCLGEVGVGIDVVGVLCRDVVGATVAHAIVELVVEVVPHIAVEGPYGLLHGGVGVEEVPWESWWLLVCSRKSSAQEASESPAATSVPIYNILVFMTC